MSDEKWAPGPWVVGDSADHGIPCVDGHAEGGGIFEICEVWGEENDTEETEMSIANAHLIAQSPAMYEFIGRLVDDGLLDLGWHEEAEALMAKARGETS